MTDMKPSRESVDPIKARDSAIAIYAVIQKLSREEILALFAKTFLKHQEAIEAVHTDTLEKAAKVAEEHYEAHCCEDCPCAYWRENTAKAIRRLK